MKMPKLSLLFLFCLLTTFCFSQNYDGIDVSHHQKQINWKKVAQNKNIQFVYLKATEGATYVDPNFHRNAKNAIANGLKVGVYHYFRMTSSATAQFKNFQKAYEAYDFQLLPMVDVEQQDGKPIKIYRDSLRRFISLIEEAYGVSPVIYATNRSYNQLCGTDFDGRCLLYIGRYGENKPVVKGKSHYAIWQFSQTGRISGISTNVDLCKFHSKNGIKDILFSRKKKKKR